MKLKNAFGSLVFASLCALPSVGCMVHGSGGAYISAPVAVVEIEQEPPPPRMMVVDTRPGFVLIQGRWDWRGGQWVWRDGYYERERVGYHWEQGRWERRGRGHVWVEGRWGSAANRVDRAERREDRRERVRDHREDRREDRRDHRDNGRGPIIRDHR